MSQTAQRSLPRLPSRPSHWKQLWSPLLRLSLGVCLALSPFVFAACGFVVGVSHAQPLPSDAEEVLDNKNFQDYQAWVDRGGIRFWIENPPALSADQLNRFLSQMIFGLTPRQDTLLRQKDPTFPKMHTVRVISSFKTPLLYINVDSAYYERVTLEKKLHLPLDTNMTMYNDWVRTLPPWRRSAFADAASQIAMSRGGAPESEVGFTEPATSPRNVPETEADYTTEEGSFTFASFHSPALIESILHEILICQKHSQPLPFPKEEALLQQILRINQTASKQSKQLRVPAENEAHAGSDSVEANSGNSAEPASTAAVGPRSGLMATARTGNPSGQGGGPSRASSPGRGAGGGLGTVSSAGTGNSQGTGSGRISSLGRGADNNPGVGPGTGRSTSPGYGTGTVAGFGSAGARRALPSTAVSTGNYISKSAEAGKTSGTGRGAGSGQGVGLNTGNGQITNQGTGHGHGSGTGTGRGTGSGPGAGSGTGPGRGAGSASGTATSASGTVSAEVLVATWSTPDLPADIAAWLATLEPQTPPLRLDPPQAAAYAEQWAKLLRILQTFTPDQRQRYFFQVLRKTADLTTLLQKLAAAQAADALDRARDAPQALTDDQALATDIDTTWKSTTGDWEAFQRLNPGQRKHLLTAFQRDAQNKYLGHIARHPLRMLQGMSEAEVDAAIEQSYQAAHNPALSQSERIGAAFQGHAALAGKLSLLTMGVGAVLVIGALIFATPAAAIAGALLVGKVVLASIITSLLCSGASVAAYQQACADAKTEQEAKRTCSAAAQEGASLTANLALMGLVEAVGALIQLPPVKSALTRARQSLAAVTSATTYQAWLGVEPGLIVSNYRASVERFLKQGLPTLPPEHALLMGVQSGPALVEQLTSPLVPLSLVEKLSPQQLADLKGLAARPGGRAVLEATWARAKEQLARLPERQEALALGVVAEVEKGVETLKRAPSKEEAGRILDRLAQLDKDKGGLQASVEKRLKAELTAEQVKLAEQAPAVQAEPVQAQQPLAATGTDGAPVQTLPQTGTGAAQSGKPTLTVMSGGKPGARGTGSTSTPGSVTPARGGTASSGGPRGGTPAAGAQEMVPGRATGPVLEPEGTRTRTAPSELPEHGAATSVEESVPLRHPSKPTPTPEQIRAWIKDFEATDTPQNHPRSQYEIQQTGPKNVVVEGGGERIAADGITETGYLQEAKFVGNPKRSPYIECSNCYDIARENTIRQVNDEFQRYKAVINDPATPIIGLELITNTPEARPFFEKLFQKYGIPGRIIIKP